MQSILYTYKKGDNGEPLLANVHWSSEASGASNSRAPICNQASISYNVLADLVLGIILHGGGLTVGSHSIIPASQISYLVSLGFVVVVPNYRLCPQVTAFDGAYVDTASALTWCKDDLPGLLQEEHHVFIDGARIAAMGHSAGGTLALWLGSQNDPPQAIANFYPSLYLSSTETTGHKPYPGFAAVPDFQDTEANIDALMNRPSEEQISVFPMAFPGQPPEPRTIWLLSHLKHGTWLSAAQPNGDYKAIDPCVHFADKGKSWPPTMFVQGDKDDLPGSNLEYVERAISELKNAGASKIELEKVEGASHMFDMQPDAAVGQGGRKAEAVKAALDFLRENV